MLGQLDRQPLLDLRGGAEDAPEDQPDEVEAELEELEAELEELEETDDKAEETEEATDVEVEAATTPEPPPAPTASAPPPKADAVASAPPPATTAAKPAEAAAAKPAETTTAQLAETTKDMSAVYSRKSSSKVDPVAAPVTLPELPEMDILKATYECNTLRSSVLAEAMEKVTALRRVLESGEAIPEFGNVADVILNQAITKFHDGMPKGDAQVAELSQRKADEMRGELMMSIEPAFVQQICLLKDAALELFKKGLAEGDGAQAFASAEVAFARSASDCVPAQTGWTFQLERESLIAAMKAILGEQKKASSAKIQSAQQMQTALAYLQLQQKQMEEIQGSAMRAQGSKWTLGAAYRPEATSINLSAAYQQGRCNLQVSRVPDEQANLLGADGFKSGVAPANLGLSFNVHF